MAIATVPAVTEARELALLKAVGLDRISPEQRELALNIAGRYELDLMLKHLVMIDGRPYITRDGLLHVAHRSGALDGIETTDPTLSDGFWRASCSVYRKDMSRPFTYSGRYPEKGQNARFGPEMAVKVAEVMALRRAFDVAAPVAEERWEQDIPVTEPQPRPTLAERAAEKAAEIVQLPPDVTAEDVEVIQVGWDYAHFRDVIRESQKSITMGKVHKTASDMYPGRDLELHEPAAWSLTPEEWEALAKRLVA